MSKLVERVVQTSHVNIYYPGAANCTGSTVCDANTKVSTCNDCDWHFADVTCKNGCPSQPACSGIDGNVCPQLGTNIEYHFSEDNGICLANTDKQPLVDCTYDASTFDYTDIVAFQEEFCGGNCDTSTNFNNILMPNFCFKSTTICPDIPGTNTSWKECPIILSNLSGAPSGNAGADCMNWSSKNPAISNTTMNQFCSANPSDPTCGCINRNKSEVFNYINANLSNIDPSCWYTPCANPQAFLVPSVLTDSVECTGVCSKINSIIATIPTNLTLKQLQNEIECAITSTPVPIPPGNTNNTGSSSSTSSSSFFSSTTFWVIFGIVLFLIIVIILAFLLFS
jgi:hypothetical protein